MKSSIIILIIEDDALFAKNIETQLRKIGYQHINIAITYHKAISSIKRDKPDLILLDINLKNKKYSGIDIANDNMVLNKIPVIYLTADKRSKIREKVEQTNPKSYMTKPLRYEELEVNIHMALGHKHGTIDIGYGFSYSLKNRNLFYNSKPIKLSQYEKIILDKLIEYRGEPIPQSVLEFEIWGNEPISKSSLRTLISKLRKKLNQDIIITVSSFGYKLLLPKDKLG